MAPHLPYHWTCSSFLSKAVESRASHPSDDAGQSTARDTGRMWKARGRTGHWMLDWIMSLAPFFDVGSHGKFQEKWEPGFGSATVSLRSCWTASPSFRSHSHPRRPTAQPPVREPSPAFVELGVETLAAFLRGSEESLPIPGSLRLSWPARGGDTLRRTCPLARGALAWLGPGPGQYLGP